MLFKDQLNRNISIKYPIKSIISLVPSHTELLFDLGLKDMIKARTKFCIHPQSDIQNIPIIGGTKTINIDIIRSIGPDLIIANKEENNKEDVQAIENDFPVWVSNIKTIEHSIDMIHRIAILFNKQERAKLIEDKTYSKIRSLASSKTKRTAYLIWQNPYMTVGVDTYIHNMMSQLGFENVFVDRKRYPEVTIQEIKDANPELIMLSSEPYPFKEKHKIQCEKLFEGTQVETVDGEVFSWFGSRIIHKSRF